MEERHTEISDKSKGVHYSYTLTAISAFIFGVIAILLFNNYASAEKISFSTVGIINLVFSIGLSTASIVLAITAIVLSKKSEQTIMQRNDDGIKYQSEIFNKTIDVLSKIETSTGISEKRIEDITREIKSIERSKPGPKSKDDQVKEALRRALHSHPEKSDIRSKKVPDKQEEFTKSVMETLSQIRGVSLVRVSSGDFDESGEEMVDGIFSMAGQRFSVSTFYFYGPAKIANFADSDTYKQYFLNLASEISKNTFEKSFLVFNKDVDNDEEFKNLFNSTLNILDKKIAPKIVLASGSLENIKKVIAQVLGVRV